jgi:hypothetical protein
MSSPLLIIAANTGNAIDFTFRIASSWVAPYAGTHAGCSQIWPIRA